MTGQVIEERRGQYIILGEAGEVTATLKGIFYHEAEDAGDFPCVGDFVEFELNDNGPSRISKLLPRRTKFSRADFSGHKAEYVKNIKEQVVAANFDYVFILTSLNRDFRISRILRYLSQSLQSGAQPVIILTKADLTEDFNPQTDEVKKYAPDVPVHAISSHTGFGLDALQEYLKPGKCIVFLGMSGVGKSSLLNALAGEELMEIKETRREDSSKGSHTTTHRQLFTLPTGTMVIDTPGMRELGLYDAEDGISIGFADVEDLFTQCKFNNCRHEKEPGCAVRKALRDGTLAESHWEAYLKQQRENKFVESKADFMRQKNERHKSITRHFRAVSKNNRKVK